MTEQSDTPVSAIPGHDEMQEHSHGISIPAWVTWAIVGFGVGIIAWAAIDSYVRERRVRAAMLEPQSFAHVATVFVPVKSGSPNGSKPVSDEQVVPDPVL